MKCIICPTGETQPGLAMLTFPREDHVFVVRDVPADICDTCGEEYVSEQVGRQLFNLLDRTAKGAAPVELLVFDAA